VGFDVYWPWYARYAIYHIVVAITYERHLQADVGSFVLLTAYFLELFPLVVMLLRLESREYRQSQNDVAWLKFWHHLNNIAANPVQTCHSEVLHLASK